MVPSLPLVKIEQPCHEVKLDISVSTDGIEALEYSIIGAGGFKFCGLVMKGHYNGSSMKNIFEGFCTEKGTVAGKSIFEGVLIFSGSDARNKFDGTYSAVQREEDRSASPPPQEYQKLEGKMKQNFTGESLGSNQGATRE